MATDHHHDRLIETVLDSHKYDVDAAIDSLSKLSLSTSTSRSARKFYNGMPAIDSSISSHGLLLETNTFDSNPDCSSKSKVHGVKALNATPTTDTDNNIADAKVAREDVLYMSRDGTKWVELFVREMLKATSLDDARERATRALEAFQGEIMTLSKNRRGLSSSLKSEQDSTTYQNHVSMLEGKLQSMADENHILKRAVAVQHKRWIQHERNCRYTVQQEEMQKLKQSILEQQDQIRTLELINYALALHLQEAQKAACTPLHGNFHPDVF